MRPFAKTFYQSKEWKSCRASYYKAKHGLCENCLKSGKYEVGEIVHHKIHLTPDNITNPDVALNFDNLELLCRKCHGEEHGAQIKRYRVDNMGNVSPL